MGRRMLLDLGPVIPDAALDPWDRAEAATRGETLPPRDGVALRLSGARKSREGYINRVIDEVGYEAPSPIQAQSIPPLLAGRDVLGEFHHRA